MYTVPQCSTSTNKYLAVVHSDYSAQTSTVGQLSSHLYCRHTGRLSQVAYIVGCLPPTWRAALVNLKVCSAAFQQSIGPFFIPTIP